MKKFYLVSVFCFIAFFAKAQFPAPYCAEEYVSGVEPITSVIFDSINNQSIDTLDGVPHEDFTFLSTTLTQALTYTITLKGNTSGSFTNYFTVFIDWNQDNDFDDADERYDIGTINNSTGTDSKFVSGSIAVPINALEGSTRMRVVKHYASYQAAPCLSGGFLHYGEAEDYTINVVAGANCAGAPPSTTAKGPSSSCVDSLITVSLTGLTTGVGITFQWQSTTIGGNTWTNIVGATDATTSFPHASGGLDYRCVVTCINGNLSTNSSVLSVQSLNCSPPVNDDYCSAIGLVLDGPSDCQNTKYATSAADPGFVCSAPNNTTWYTYTPSVSGNVELKITAPLSGDTLNGRVAVYTVSGSCPSALTFTEVTTTVFGSCIEFGSAGQGTETFVADLVAGNEYYFMIDGFFGDDGEYCISLKTPPPPPTTCATNIKPADMSIDVSAPNTILKWTPIVGATSYDVYFGTVNPPTTRIGTIALDSVNLTGLIYSTTYYWYVVPKNTGGSALGCDANITSFTTVAPPPPPSNDECDSAIVLNSLVSLFGTTSSATQSMPGQTCVGFTGTADDDVWYQFTANNNGDATITVTPIGTNFDGVVVVYSGTCGNLTSIDCADSTFSGQTEILNLTGLNAGETYYLRVYSYSSSTANQGSFNITIEGTALPVSLTEFKGYKKGKFNELVWSTANELNNKGYEVQKSFDATHFLPITFLESKGINGNSSTNLDYNFTDFKNVDGSVFYRLKQIDKNGKSSFSKVISVKGEKSGDIIITDIYPNPAISNVNAIISSSKQQNISLTIVDVFGKILMNKNAQIQGGFNTLSLNIDKLSKGNYFIKIINDKGMSISVNKFVK
jgi:hypothetical protein